MKKILSLLLAVILVLNSLGISKADASEYHSHSVDTIDYSNVNEYYILTLEQTGTTYVVFNETTTSCVSTFVDGILVKTTTLDKNLRVLSETAYSEEAIFSDPNAISNNYGCKTSNYS